MGVKYFLTTLLISVTLAIGVVGIARAERYSSTSYTIDASVTSSAGGAQTSNSYRLTSATGENVIGNGAGGSYKMGMGYAAQLEKSLTLTVQPSGLVGYWPLNEPSGGYAYDATPNSQTLSLSGQTYAAGKLGSALQLDATTAVATASTSTALNFQSSDFTVEFWYKPTLVTGSRDIFRKGTLSSNGFEAALVGAAPALFVSSTANYRYCSAITAGSWAHIAFVKSGTTLDCYINGALANGTLGGSIPSNIGSATGQFTVGGVGEYGVGPNGLVDEMKFFNTALSAAAVKTEYGAEDSGYTSGVSLGTIVPGVSAVVLADVVTETDIGGYSLAISQNHDLTDGTNMIPAIGGSIAAPLAWSEGTTKGLGFTLTATNATAIPGTWNSGNSYAAFPATATTFYTRSGLQSGKDYLTMRLRADVANSQIATVATPYSNVITVTGTIQP